MNIKKKYLNIFMMCISIFFVTSCTEEKTNSDIQLTTIYSYNEEDDLIESIVMADQVVESKIFLSESQNYFIRTFGRVLDRETVLLRIGANATIEMIGWSENGLFAYRLRRYMSDGRFEGWVYALVVIDTNSNRLVEWNSFEMSDWMFYDGEFIPVTEEMLYELSREYGMNWNTLLETHNISGRVESPFESNFHNNLLEFPINGFHCLFYVLSETEWKLVLDNGVVQKLINKNIGEEDQRWDNTSARKILGYFKSPYDNRIVVVVAWYYWGAFSGGISNAGFELFGFNMDYLLEY